MTYPFKEAGERWRPECCFGDGSASFSALSGDAVSRSCRAAKGQELLVNVIVICLDTLRWDGLGHNLGSWIRTPAIDSFAKKATIFDRAYCASFPTVPMRVD